MENRFKSEFRYWNGISKMMCNEPMIRKGYEFSLSEYMNTDRGWVWMESIGFTDKNDKLIYESDNCNIKDKNGTEFNGVITRNKFNELVFKENEQGVEYHLSDFLKTGYEHTIEITGNIYIINKQ